ncbi:carboxypeptidase regulatory-like domain-containing protein [Nitrospinaceae bacterium]|nr:carboxypeptidase regulatory-like domain-containing protein [Nitrospinaceae bacterium]
MHLVSYLLLAVILSPELAISGSLSGTAIFSGKIEQLKPYKTGKYKKACGTDIPNESMLINNKRVGNVVISLHGKKLKKRGGKYKLDQKKCRYEPHVIAVPLDSELKIHTSDPINHNIHTYSFENDPINIMFLPGQDAYSQEMDEAEIIKVECDLHDWMRAWIVVTPNAYSTVSGADGSFEIPDVPPGKYELTAWHETLGSLTKNITVGNDGLNVNFDFLEVPQQEAKR